MDRNETTMKSELIVSHLGLDNHPAFSRVTARDAQNRVVWRQRLEHRDRQVVRTQLRSWPAGTPVILAGLNESFPVPPKRAAASCSLEQIREAGEVGVPRLCVCRFGPGTE